MVDWIVVFTNVSSTLGRFFQKRTKGTMMRTSGMIRMISVLHCSSDEDTGHEGNGEPNPPEVTEPVAIETPVAPTPASTPAATPIPVTTLLLRQMPVLPLDMSNLKSWGFLKTSGENLRAQSWNPSHSRFVRSFHWPRCWEHFLGGEAWTSFTEAAKVSWPSFLVHSWGGFVFVRNFICSNRLNGWMQHWNCIWKSSTKWYAHISHISHIHPMLLKYVGP